VVANWLTQLLALVTRLEYVPAPPVTATMMEMELVLVVRLKPFGPCTRYVKGPVPPAPAVTFVGEPAQTVVPTKDAVGFALTMTTVVANWLTQLLALVTRLEYVPVPPVTVTEIDVALLFVVRLKPPGPFTRYVNGATPLAPAVTFVGEPTQTVVPTNDAVGFELMMTSAVANWLMQLLALVTRLE
jgi:hypothetical protein